MLVVVYKYCREQLQHLQSVVLTAALSDAGVDYQEGRSQDREC
jgi:hypothetical protein